MTRHSIGLLCVAATVLTACADDPPEPSRDAVFPADYRESFVQLRTCRQSIEHDLEFVELWVSPDHAALFDDCVSPALPCDAPLPAGVVVIKPQFLDAGCSTPIRTAAAQRLHGEDLGDGAAWLWQEVDPDGRSTGNDGTACIACHQHCDPAYDLRCVMDP